MAVLGGGLFLMSEVPLYSHIVTTTDSAARLHPSRGTSLIRNTPLLAPFSSLGSYGGPMGVVVSYVRGIHVPDSTARLASLVEWRATPHPTPLQGYLA